MREEAFSLVIGAVTTSSNNRNDIFGITTVYWVPNYTSNIYLQDI